MEHIPGRNNMLPPEPSLFGAFGQFLCTSDKVVHPAGEGYSCVHNLRPSDFCALHSHQDQDGSKERQDDSNDNEGSTHVDVPCPGQHGTLVSGGGSLFKSQIYFTHSSVPAWKGSPCSRILRLSRRCSPSTGWRSSLRWSRQCSPPLTRSRSQWAWWNRPGSSPTHTAQSIRSPYTSPQSCKP